MIPRSKSQQKRLAAQTRVRRGIKKGGPVLVKSLVKGAKFYYAHDPNKKPVELLHMGEGSATVRRKEKRESSKWVGSKKDGFHSVTEVKEYWNTYTITLETKVFLL